MNPALVASSVLTTSDRSNAFGALRLVLASMVIFAHVPELLDGDRHREPVTALFHNGLTSGMLAVDGFFLVSGYLISQSWRASPSTYFVKRILRIYPAFVLCSAVLLLVVGPLGGGEFPHDVKWLRAAYRMLILQAPVSEGAFDQLAIPALNASMWTIAYEFRCYVLTALMGALGLLERPLRFAALTVGVFALQYAPLPDLPQHAVQLVGHPGETARLTGIFMAGVCFRILQPPLTTRWAVAAAAALFGLLFVQPVAEPAFVLFGGYVLFWIALKVRWAPLLALNAKDDISYGVYLWAWPVSALTLVYWPDATLPGLLALTFAGALALGTASWFLVEKPTMALRGRIQTSLTMRGQTA